jgi:hypothetical protein
MIGGKLMDPSLEAIQIQQNLLKLHTPSPQEKILEKVGNGLRDHYAADYQYEIIMKSITEFEASLDDQHEVAVQLASFGQSLIMQVVEIGFVNPLLLRFYGYVNGNKAELIQNISQLNFLLMASRKADPEKPARRIGFLKP